MAQTLTTPVVSVATPSLLAQGLPFSAMPTAYNTGELLVWKKISLKTCITEKNINVSRLTVDLSFSGLTLVFLGIHQ